MLSSSSFAASSGSNPGINGASSALFEGRNDSNRRTSANVSLSPSIAKCATPDCLACASAPPNSSCVISSPVTERITSGPVIYI